MSRVVIAGGSGFVGRALVNAFVAQGREVVVLSRGGGVVDKATTVRWDFDPDGSWTSQIDGAAAVINVCGSSVSVKWTLEAQKGIRDSRVVPTKAIGEAIKRCRTAPKLWVNISGTGYYGNRGDEQMTEASTPGDDFLAMVSAEWEAACLDSGADVPKVIQRMGVVLSRDGGAFGYFRKIPFGGVGSGKQWVSWVHLADVVGMAQWAVADPFEGVVNCCAPEPVTNARLFREINERRGLPPLPPMPGFVFQAVAAAKGMEASLMLEGQRVLPVIAQARGYVFKYPTFESALEELMGR